MKRTYEVFEYDVWGNEHEGYDVNNRMRSGCEVTLDEDATDAQIIKALKDCGFLRKGLHTKSFDIEGEMDYTLYVTRARDMYPVCELVAE